MDAAVFRSSARRAGPGTRQRGVGVVSRPGVRVATRWGRRRWLRHAGDYAVRIASIAAGLCPALSSLGGALVGALVAATVAVALAERP